MLKQLVPLFLENRLRQKKQKLNKDLDKRELYIEYLEKVAVALFHCEDYQDLAVTT